MVHRKRLFAVAMPRQQAIHEAPALERSEQLRAVADDVNRDVVRPGSVQGLVDGIAACIACPLPNDPVPDSSSADLECQRIAGGRTELVGRRIELAARDRNWLRNVRLRDAIGAQPSPRNRCIDTVGKWTVSGSRNGITVNSFCDLRLLDGDLDVLGSSHALEYKSSQQERMFRLTPHQTIS